MTLADWFLKQCPEWTPEQAEEAEQALLRYFELLLKISKEKNTND